MNRPSPLPRVARFLRLLAPVFAGAFALAATLRANLLAPELGRPVFRDFRPTEYRGHPQVFAIVQSPEGFIYFGNQEGIIEFDGSRWTHLPAPTSLIFRLAVGRDGRLWAGGNDLLGHYAVNTAGTRAFHSVVDRLPDTLKPWGATNTVLVDGDDAYFSSARGIVRVRGDDIQTWVHETPVATTLHHVGNRVLAFVAGRGLVELEAGGTLKLFSAIEPFNRTVRGASLPLPDGRTLFLVTNAGACAVDPHTGTWTRVEGHLDELARSTRINTALVLPDGSFAIATASQGLVVTTPDLRRFRRFDRRTGLADNAIISLALDREGGLWTGFNSGAARLAIANPVSVFDATNGPTPGTIDAWGRHDGRLYCGTYDGLYRLEPAGRDGSSARFVRLTDRVTHIFGFASHQGRLLIASQAGLFQLNDDDTVTALFDGRANQPYALVASQKSPGRFYLPGQTGVTIVEHDASGWHKLAENTTLGDAHTGVLDRDGSLWIATYNRGFWRLPAIEQLDDPSAATYEQYFRGHGLPDNIVWTTVTPGVGGPVFFSDKGQRRFDPARGAFVPETRFALPDATSPLVTPTILSGRDTWASVFGESTIAAKHPLGRFRTGADGRSTWQSAPAEALGEIGFSGAAVMWIDHTPDGDVLWARGYNNTIRYELAARASVAAAPWRALIRDVQAEGRHRAVAATDADTPARFSYSREPLVFELAAPRFAALDGLRFQTRLVGFSEKWSEPSPTARVSYTNLEGGPFTLEARAIDAAGRLSEVAHYTFSVAPPWHRSPLAYVLYALLLAIAIAAYIRLRLATARREQARLEQLVAQRTVELAAARDEAQAASHAKSSFLAHMSHELRTPLNGIIGYAQVLLKDRDVAGPQRERVNIVHASGQHLLRMINEVLDFSKIEAGKIERHDTAFNLPQLLRELTITHEAAAHGRGLSFTVEMSRDVPEVLVGDAQKLRQVLDNLLSNAVKFTKTGGVTLRVGCEDRGHEECPGPGGTAAARDFIRFEVIDTGVGLGADDRARLFQPFEQARDGRPAEPGTGLGLAISQRLVRLLGGELRVDSTPGVGSRFWFTLPLSTADASALRRAKPHALAGYRGPRQRILVVDDNRVNRSLLTEMLAPLGLEVSEFANAEELLGIAPGELQADLAFLDVKMPGIDGLELARRLRARDDARTLPIVFTSASVLTFDRAAAEALGAPNFLPKPFAETELHALLERLLPVEWDHAAPTHAGMGAGEPGAERAPGTNGEGATAHPTALPPQLLVTLLAHADAGDVAALRSALADARRSHPQSASALADVEAAAVAYRLEHASHLLRRLSK